MSPRLENKVALITGASRGIGRATALAFAREGASVIVNYAKSRDGAEAVVKQIRESGGAAEAVQADVGDRAQVDSMARRAIERFGRIDLLVNNAGITIPGETLTLSTDDLDTLMATNVKGVIHCVQACAPSMIEHGGGKIANVSSIAAIGTALHGSTTYAATKAAVLALTRRFALELGPHQINVNAVCPGLINTAMAAAGGSQDYFIEHSVLGRTGQPEEIAEPLVFLCSDEASFITGQVLTVDGGRTDYLSRSG
jgi:3-oxoacyl-[acyl-carrier protein] reductase